MSENRGVNTMRGAQEIIESTVDSRGEESTDGLDHSHGGPAKDGAVTSRKWERPSFFLNHIFRSTIQNVPVLSQLS